MGKTPNAVGAPLTKRISSTYDFMQTPSKYMKLFQEYNIPQTLMRTLKDSMSEFEVKNDFITAHSESLGINTVTVKSIDITGAPDIVIEVGDDDVDAQGNIYPRVSFTLIYQHTDNKVYPLSIQSITPAGGGDNPKLVCRLFTDAIVAGDLNISATDVLSVGGSNFADGTGMPSSVVSGFYETTFGSYIVKDSFESNGIELAKEQWFERMANGYVNMWSRGVAKMDYRFDLQEGHNFLFGNDNATGITQDDKHGVATPRKSAKGIWNILLDEGGTLPWTGASFDYYKMGQVLDYMRSNRAVTNVYDIKAAPELTEAITLGGYDFSSQVSNGADFTRVVERSYAGSEELALGSSFKIINYNGTLFNVQEIPEFGDPFTVGNKQYNLYRSGMIIPAGSRSVNNYDGEEYPTMGIGHVVHNGVNRKRFITDLPGATGEVGKKALNGIDSSSIHMTAERIPFFMEAWKCMSIQGA